MLFIGLLIAVTTCQNEFNYGEYGKFLIDLNVETLFVW